MDDGRLSGATLRTPDAPAAAPGGGETERRSALMRWRDGIRAHPAGRLTLKIVVGVLGTAMVIGGLIMVPFPGPGWLVVFAGLALLATEFAWAHRLLEFGKRILGRWTQWLVRQSWPVRILVSAVTLCVAGAIVWCTVRLTLGVDLVKEGLRFVGR